MIGLRSLRLFLVVVVEEPLEVVEVGDTWPWAKDLALLMAVFLRSEPFIMMKSNAVWRRRWEARGRRLRGVND
jgi:hypothetical protein